MMGGIGWCFAAREVFPFCPTHSAATVAWEEECHTKTKEENEECQRERKEERERERMKRSRKCE
jgi:hypothetical protein